MPDLSIIIISYNTQAITLNCVKSIVKSINNISCEVIVIDNASEDKTIEELEKLKNTNQNSKILINIVKNTENIGYGKANNQGIKLAQSDYILLLNSDTVVIDNAIEKLLWRYEAPRPTSCDGVSLQSYGEQNPSEALLSRAKGDKNTKDQFQFLGGKLLNQDNTPQPSCGPFYSLPMIFAHLFLRGDYWGLTRYSPTQEKTVDWISGACILTKKSYLEKLNGFDENIFMYMDEIDLLYRAHKLGYKTLFYPDTHFIHLGSGSSSGKTFPIIQVFKGLKYFYKKHHSPIACRMMMIMLKLKALIGIFLGKLFNNRYLIETYEKAYQVAQMA